MIGESSSQLLDGFTRTLKDTTSDWDQLSFKTIGQKPGHYFARKWTADNAIQSSNKMKAKGFWPSVGVAAFGVLAPIIAFPAGLVVTAVAGIPAIHTIAKSKLSTRQISRDNDLINQTFPKMQEELVKILDSVQKISQTINTEFQNGELSQKERLAAFSRLEESLKEFMETSLGVDQKGLKRGRPATETGRQNDYSAFRLCSNALKSLDESRALKLEVTGPSSGLGKNLDRGTLDPNTKGLGPDSSHTLGDR